MTKISFPFWDASTQYASFGHGHLVLTPAVVEGDDATTWCQKQFGLTGWRVSSRDYRTERLPTAVITDRVHLTSPAVSWAILDGRWFDAPTIRILDVEDSYQVHKINKPNTLFFNKP